MIKETKLFDGYYLSGPVPSNWHWLSQNNSVKWLLSVDWELSGRKDKIHA